MKLVKIFILSLFVPVLLWAGETVEINGGPEEVNVKLIAVLNNINPNFYSDEKTQGFNYRYRHRWYNPYDFNIYVGKVGKNSPDSIIRVESPRRGQEKMWKQIFEQTLLQKAPGEDSVKLSDKYHVISQGLNLVTPMASVMYNSWKSPLYTNRDTISSVSMYFLLDLILVGATYLYAQENLPKKTWYDNLFLQKGPGGVWDSPNAVAIYAALAATRVFRMFDAWEDTQSHNNTAKLGWSFKF